MSPLQVKTAAFLPVGCTTAFLPVLPSFCIAFITTVCLFSCAAVCSACFVQLRFLVGLQLSVSSCVPLAVIRAASARLSGHHFGFREDRDEIQIMAHQLCLLAVVFECSAPAKLCSSAATADRVM